MQKKALYQPSYLLLGLSLAAEFATLAFIRVWQNPIRVRIHVLEAFVYSPYASILEMVVLLAPPVSLAVFGLSKIRYLTYNLFVRSVLSVILSLSLIYSPFIYTKALYVGGFYFWLNLYSFDLVKICNIYGSECHYITDLQAASSIKNCNKINSSAKSYCLAEAYNTVPCSSLVFFLPKDSSSLQGVDYLQARQINELLPLHGGEKSDEILIISIRNKSVLLYEDCSPVYL